MGCQMYLGGSALTGEVLDGFHQQTPDAHSPDIRIDGYVHEMSVWTVQTQDRATDNAAIRFGDEDLVLLDVFLQAGRDVRQVRQG